MAVADEYVTDLMADDLQNVLSRPVVAASVLRICRALGVSVEEIMRAVDTD